MKNIRNKITFKALTLREAAREKALALRAKALDTTGEGYVDTAVKIIIAVVIGALLMAGLVALFNGHHAQSKHRSHRAFRRRRLMERSAHRRGAVSCRAPFRRSGGEA